MSGAWLLRSVRTCIHHGIQLVELPYRDYTTCYDHIARSQFRHRWLDSLPSMLESQRPSDFEIGVLVQIFLRQPICPWLGNVQVDVLERWCLGLGLFLEIGVGRPDDLDQSAQCQMIDAGYSVTKAGRTALHVAVDEALGRHGIRLGKTWLYNWVFQNLTAPERSIFRKQMKDMCDAQGDHCLHTVAATPPISRAVELQVKALAQQTGRPVSWIKDPLITDGYLAPSGIPHQRHLNNRFYYWRTYISSLQNSLNSRAAANHLGLGCKGFENLANDGVLRPIKSRVYAKPRFDPVDLGELIAAVQRHLTQDSSTKGADFVSIPEACFQTSCATSTVINLLTDGHLKSAIWTEQDKGFAGIVIDPVELKSKLAWFSKTGLTIEDLRDRLGLQYTQVKKLIARDLLPAFIGRKASTSRRALFVDPSDLADFLGEYQTVRTAASLLSVSENVLRDRISNGCIMRAPEGGGLPIYRAAKILAN